MFMFLFIKKKLIFIIVIMIFLLILAYVVNINSIPDNIILFNGNELILKTIAGIKIKQINSNNEQQTIETSTDVNEDSRENKKNLQQEKKYNLSLLGINLKTVTASEIENRKVILLGNIIGLKLYTKGVLVVGVNAIESENKKIYKPYEEAGIEQGDSIIKINGEDVNSTQKLMQCLSKSSNKKIDITYIKKGKEIKKTITPIKTGKNTYKLGLWVRDSSAGIGTLTFYDKLTNSLVSLGHGIQDIDTGEKVDISYGELVFAKIKNIQKGKKDVPRKNRRKY